MIYIYYHSADDDGKTSGAIMYEALKGQDSISLRGIDYAKYDFETECNSWDPKTDKVYLADFNFEGNMDKALDKMGENFIFIDHHKTAIEEIEGLEINGLRQVGIAACRLCWKYFFPNKPEPKSVTLIGRYDVFDLDDEVETFQLGVSLLDLSPDSINWRTVFKSSPEFIAETCQKGELIRKYVEIKNRETAEMSSHEINLEGYVTVALNARGDRTRAFQSVFDPNKHEVMMSYVKMNQGDLWKVSFFSEKDDVDVSEIAKKFGGGGHANASGCEIDSETLMEILKS